MKSVLEFYLYYKVVLDLNPLLMLEENKVCYNICLFLENCLVVEVGNPY